MCFDSKLFAQQTTQERRTADFSTVEGDEDTVYATARTVLVWVDRATGRAVPLPDVVRDRLADD